MAVVSGRWRRQERGGGVVGSKEVQLGGRGRHELGLDGQERPVIGQARVDESRRLGRMVNEKGLSVPVLFVLPPGWQFPVLAGEHV